MSPTLRLFAACALASLLPAFGLAHDRTPAAAAGARAGDETTTPAEDAARKRKKVTELLVAMNQKEVAKVALDQALTNIAEMGMPQTFRDCFRDGYDLEHVLEFTTDVYAEQLDEATIDALLAFYKSEGGKACAEKLPAITLETMKRGSDYGRKVGGDCAQGR